MFRKIIATDAARTTILIRLMVGAIFLSEGIQKFLFAEKSGTGRFEKMGLPDPNFLGPFVGSFEIICGILILFGLFTRLAAIPLLIIIIVAITATKVQLITGEGFWSMLHESRTDWSMFLGSMFLIIKGGGKWSFDRKIMH